MVTWKRQCGNVCAQAHSRYKYSRSWRSSTAPKAEPSGATHGARSLRRSLFRVSADPLEGERGLSRCAASLECSSGASVSRLRKGVQKHPFSSPVEASEQHYRQSSRLQQIACEGRSNTGAALWVSKESSTLAVSLAMPRSRWLTSLSLLPVSFDYLFHLCTNRPGNTRNGVLPLRVTSERPWRSSTDSVAALQRTKSGSSNRHLPAPPEGRRSRESKARRAQSQLLPGRV